MSMTMAAVVDTNGNNDYTLPPRKKPKVSDLPLSSAKRASIDGLLHTFKKKGEFDSLRKKTWAQFEEKSKSTLIQSLQAFTDAEIERDAQKYLGKDRRLAAPLLEGAAARADIYPATEADIDRYISTYLKDAEAALRDIRRKEIGDEAAKEEEARGARSDEAYAEDAEVRRQERAKRYAEQLRIQKKKEKEAKKKAELEALKAREAQLVAEKEKLQREAKRRAERDGIRKKEEERKKERLKQMEEERERKKKEREAEEKRLEEERAARKKKEEEEELKRLEAEAERMLLRESQRMMEKTSRRDRDREHSEEAAPPSHREYVPDKRAAQDKRASTVRDPRDHRGPSPTPERERYSTRRDDRSRPPYYDERDDRLSRHEREDRQTRKEREDARREAHLREISIERKAWLASKRKESEQKKEPAPTREPASVRGRSKSPARAGASRPDRSPRSERYRDTRARSRTRSPPRRGGGYREREYSPPRRRRSRSRSPYDIDRYIPGSSRRRDDDRDRYAARDREDERYPPRDRERERERDRDRDRDYDRDYDRDRRRPRDYEEPSIKEIDRYIPGNSRLAERGETSLGPSAREPSIRRESSIRQERSKSRSRERHSSVKLPPPLHKASLSTVKPAKLPVPEPPKPKLQFANLKWKPDNAK